MAQYVVIGVSPFVDTSVACGPYRSETLAFIASEELDEKGYVTEVAQLFPTDEIDPPVNDEGSVD